MSTEVKDRITVPFDREQAAVLSNLAEAIRAGGLRNADVLSEVQSQVSLTHGRGQGKVFMHPEVAMALGHDGRAYLGGKAYSQWNQLSHLFAQPTLSQVHVDAVLTQLSISYRNPEYIGDQVFGRVQVIKESDKYFKFDKGPWLRSEAGIRAPGGAFPRGGYTLSTDNYSVDEWGYECPVDDRIRANSDNPLSPDKNASDFVADKIDLKLEVTIANKLFTAGNWSNTAAVTAWDANGGDPFAAFKTGRLVVNKSAGRRANTVVMGVEVAEVLMLHSALLERIKYSGSNERPAMVTPRMMAELFGVERVLIGTGIYDGTTVEPTTSVPQFIWGKYVWLGYINPSPAIETPSAGYTFTTGRKSDRYREESNKSDVIRASEAFDVKVTSADSGYLMTGVVG